MTRSRAAVRKEHEGEYCQARAEGSRGRHWLKECVQVIRHREGSSRCELEASRTRSDNSVTVGVLPSQGSQYHHWDGFQFALKIQNLWLPIISHEMLSSRAHNWIVNRDTNAGRGEGGGREGQGGGRERERTAVNSREYVEDNIPLPIFLFLFCNKSCGLCYTIFHFPFQNPVRHYYACFAPEYLWLRG